MISIVDYGLGNIAAFATMYKRMNIDARPVTSAGELAAAERIILPGVGSFDHAMELLDASGMRETLDRKVLEEKTPILGVCVGMQILCDGSDEGTAAGLGWIPGRTRALKGSPAVAGLPLPHMGWNDVDSVGDAAIFVGLDDPRFYFLHSFYFEPGRSEDSAATSEYGISFTCVVHRENIWGVQFHPEKSHHFGAAVLRNFAGI